MIFNRSKLLLCTIIFLTLPLFALAQDSTAVIKLPAPRTTGGMPLMQALSQRQSRRDYAPAELPPQVLADLLWAAFGINRPETGGRTAPTAMNLQEFDVYVVRADGVYLYDAAANTLTLTVKGDLRSQTGIQPFVADAPVNLVFVADTAKMSQMPAEAIESFSLCDAGFISENVYLFCASEGLATVVRAWVDKEALAKTMKLRPEQRVVLAQSIGYPAK